MELFSQLNYEKSIDSILPLDALERGIIELPQISHHDSMAGPEIIDTDSE